MQGTRGPERSGGTPALNQLSKSTIFSPNFPGLMGSNPFLNQSVLSLKTGKAPKNCLITLFAWVLQRTLQRQ